MFIEPESAQIVSNRIRNKLEAAGLFANSTGTAVRTIIDVFLSERIEIMRDIRFIASKAFLTTATGGYLDLIGRDLFGLSRLGTTQANATEVDGNVLLFANTGFLSNYLPSDGGGSYVPVGMELTDATNSIIYTTNKKLYIEAAATQVFISAISQEAGLQQNISAGALIRTNIAGTNVRNLSSITNGSNEETDENYRYRISLGYLAAERNNLSAIRLAALSTPGVSNVIVRNFVYGPGTVQVLIIPAGNSVSQSVLSVAEANINSIKPKEVAVFVDAPDYISVSVAYAFFGRVITSEERNALLRNVKSGVSSLISSAIGGSTFDPNSIILSALNSIPGLLGRVEKLCINGVPQNTKNYRLNADEILILDITEQEPIRVYA